MPVAFDFSHQGHALVTLSNSLSLRPILMLWLNTVIQVISEYVEQERPQ